MLNLRQIHRVVHRHEWLDLGEWVAGIEALADLSDDELEAVEGMDRGGPAEAARQS